MKSLESFDFLLRLGGYEAFAVKLTVGTGMGLVAGRKKVGRDVSGAGDVGDDLDFFLNIGKLGEELGLCVALEEVFGDSVSGLEGRGEFFHIGVVKEDLSLQNLGGLSCNISMFAKSQIQEDLHRLATFHVGKEFESE